jgi:hypothetical protein
MIDVSSITANVENEFNSGLITALAEAMVETGGTLKPLIVLQSGIDEYTTVANHEVYFAAVEAKAISPRTHETIEAIVIKDTNVEAAMRQFALLSMF